MEIDKDNNEEEESLGYIKAHKPVYGIPYKEITIEFIQTHISLEDETVIINCNDPDTQKKWEHPDFPVGPDEDSFTVLKRALEFDGFIIDSFRTYIDATEDKEGNLIIY